MPSAPGKRQAMPMIAMGAPASERCGGRASVGACGSSPGPPVRADCVIAMFPRSAGRRGLFIGPIFYRFTVQASPFLLRRPHGFNPAPACRQAPVVTGCTIAHHLDREMAALAPTTTLTTQIGRLFLLSSGRRQVGRGGMQGTVCLRKTRGGSVAVMGLPPPWPARRAHRAPLRPPNALRYYPSSHTLQRWRNRPIRGISEYGRASPLRSFPASEGLAYPDTGLRTRDVPREWQ